MNANCTRCSRARLGVGADVEQRHRVAGHGQRQRQRRAVDAARALDVEQPRRQRRAGAAGADQRLGAALGDRARGLHDRGLRRRARRAHRVGALGDRDRRVDDLDAAARARQSASAGPNSSTLAPARAASAAPAATSAGPRSAPLASTATTGVTCRRMTLVEPSGANLLTAGVVVILVVLGGPATTSRPA